MPRQVGLPTQATRPKWLGPYWGQRPKQSPRNTGFARRFLRRARIACGRQLHGAIVREILVVFNAGNQQRKRIAGDDENTKVPGKIHVTHEICATPISEVPTAKVNAKGNAGNAKVNAGNSQGNSETMQKAMLKAMPQEMRMAMLKAMLKAMLRPIQLQC